MTDLLLYFILCFAASIVVLAGLVRLTRPEKVEEKHETAKTTFTLSDEKGNVAMRWDVPSRPHQAGIFYTVVELNEDTRPLPASKHDDILDSFDYEELWEAAANIPRESQEEKAKIDRWVNEAIESAGGDFEL